ncbi:MAG: TIGR03546 family protein [Treponema sp. CETP13]|nr:MAG: TIGR03546 family protein [Treponema sp. CETP13]
MFLKYIVRILKSLNSNAHPGEIAHACALGVLLGFMPKNNALWWLIFIFTLFMRINKGSYFIFIIIGSLFAPLLDSFFDAFGYLILTIPTFESVFSAWLEIPFISFTKFNNTVVMGSFLTGVIVYIPMYMIIRIFIKIWRKYIASKFSNSRIVLAFYKIPFIKKIATIVAEVQ